MGSLGNCCCCPLIASPWLTAEATIFGVPLSVSFESGDLNALTCCQQKTSSCGQAGPDPVADCFGDLSAWVGGWSGSNLCDALTPILTKYVSDCCTCTEDPVEPDPNDPNPPPPEPCTHDTVDMQTPWIETRSRTRSRVWWWRDVRMTIKVCACTTPEGRPGYNVELKVTAVFYFIFVTSLLLKGRYRMITRLCPEGTCVIGSYVDNSGDGIPPVPLLRHNTMFGVAACGTEVPAYRPSQSVDVCNNSLDLPGDTVGVVETCDSLPTTYCDSVVGGPVTTYADYLKRRTENGWRAEQQSQTSGNLFSTWSTTECVEDTGGSTLVIPVTHPATSTEIAATCKDASGNEQGPIKIDWPTTINVTLTR